MILRQKNTILFWGFIGVLASISVYFLLPAKYSAHVLIRYDGGGNDMQMLERHITNEKIYLSSQAFIEKTLDALHEKNLYGRDQREDIAHFQNDFRVEKIPSSHILSLSLTGENAEKTAAIINTLSAFYLSERKTQKAALPLEIEHSLQRSILEKNLKDAQRALQIFLEQNNQNSDIYNADDRDIQSSLSRLHLKRKNILNLLGYETKGVHIPAFENSENFVAAKEKMIAQENHIAALIKKHGHNHPDVLKAQGTAENLKNDLSKQADMVLSPLVDSLNDIEQQIAQISEKNKESALQNNDFLHKKEILQKNIEAAKKQLYENLNASPFVSTLPPPQDGIHARLMSATKAPLQPAPKNFIFLVPLLICSLFGVLCAAIRERSIKNYIYSQQDIEESFSRPCIGMIPITDMAIPVEKIANFVLDNPYAALTESIRNIRMNLRQRMPEKSHGQIILVTSSMPGDGKTVLSCWLARLCARAGDRVLLIDADLRKPDGHKFLNLDNDKTLVEYLSSEKRSYKALIQNDRLSELDVLTGRSIPNSASDLLSSKRMESLILKLRQDYDLVIIDSPACLAVSDSKALTSLADRILYVVPWGKTKRKVVHTGIRQIDKADKQKISFVLNAIDVEKHARMGFDDTFCYYGEYKPLDHAV